MASLVTVRRFADLAEAKVAKGVLEQEGFAVFLPDDNLAQNAWHFMFAMGGIRLQVPDAEGPAARRLLAAVAEKSPDLTIERCVACGSANVFRHSSWIAGVLGLVVGMMPFVLRTRKRTCRRCGHVWEDEGDAGHDK